jgi:hypothetical protein
LPPPQLPASNCLPPCFAVAARVPSGMPAERQRASSPPSAARRQACFHGLVALGLSSGLTLVLLPRGLGAADGAAAAAAPQVARLGAPRPGDDATARPLALLPRTRRDACRGAGHTESGLASPRGCGRRRRCGGVPLRSSCIA